MGRSARTRQCLNNLETGAETMISRHPSNESAPIWSPDMAWIYFFRGSEIYRARSDGTGSPELILAPGKTVFPQVITADGRGLVYLIDGEQSGTELRPLDLDTGADEPLVKNSKGTIGRGSVHRDGKLLVYSTSETGQRRAMIKFNNDKSPGGPRTPGRAGATTWAGDRLFAFVDNEIIAADVITNGREIIVGPPVRIADGEGIRNISTFPDGKRLLLIRENKPTKGGSVRVVKNWLDIAEAGSR